MKNLKNRGLLPVLVIVLGFLLISSCDRLPGRGEKEDPEGEASQAESETVFAVAATEAVRGQITNYINLNGDIVSKTTVDTYPDAAGKLNRLLVKVGDTVSRDQAIAEIDPSRPGMTFAISQVKAAISGTVTSIPVEVGAMVSQQSPIARISRMDDLQINSYVAERFISQMRVGQRAVVTLDAFPGRTLNARVSELSPLVDPTSRTLDIKLDFTQRPRDVRAGMFAKIKIVTQQRDDVVKIPAEAIVERFGEYFVFLVTDDERAERRKVVLGIRIDGKQEIIEGIEEGETVVVRGQTLLEDGSAVKIVQSVDPLPVEDVL